MLKFCCRVSSVNKIFKVLHKMLQNSLHVLRLMFFNWLDVYQLYYNNFQKKKTLKNAKINQLKCLRKSQNFYEKNIYTRI